MPSLSRGGGPAAMPKYQRIAAALRHELDRTAHVPGARLPSERTLAARYQVNRQTIRAALQHLREDGLVVTGRRGTRPVAAAMATRAAESAPGAAPHPGPSVSNRAASTRTASTRTASTRIAPDRADLSRVDLVGVPPSLAELLGMRGGDRTLVHHRRERGPAGEVLRDAVTYFSPGAIAGSPELARCRDRVAAAGDVDPRALHRWLDRAAVDGRITETLTMTRTTHPPVASAACGLTARRTLHDGSGRLLAVTDLAFPAWDRLVLHRDRLHHTAGGYRVM
ncbi:GntR family transcriptional regulator [Streptomyces sp. NPDC096339]|uniref:GntR family transcriptional regulator n=1 Tax=Streptomyces sp. NPDC096339 TaxID=3366086 RepID=UPI0037F17B87